MKDDRVMLDGLPKIQGPKCMHVCVEGMTWTVCLCVLYAYIYVYMIFGIAVVYPCMHEYT